MSQDLQPIHDPVEGWYFERYDRAYGRLVSQAFTTYRRAIEARDTGRLHWYTEGQIARAHGYEL